ncbi:TRAP transporter substrate-binding protein [Ruegeria sp. 2012CJ41-6]|uniref:TRAP transporter substrate-binding protein n=1 Tax=Ruegeria spongiae TaxID=2942209 RepID=A0ABT0Q1G8_9RHOB|nr:TRAP transporter substrate-binding protein [Ruegeria spongiae]MCL6283720.1 TRAP transporter substrate-binding protein [Ruegeria spongiae]
MIRKYLGALSFAILAVASLAAGALTATAEPRVTIKYAHCCPADHTYGVYAHQLAERVAANSNGEIVIEVLDGGVMGSEQAAAQKVQLGTVQMSGITANNVAQLAPSLNVLVLPYLNGSPDDLTGEGGLLRAGAYRDELNKRVLGESGSIRVVGGYTNSFRSLFSKDQCIDSIDDLQGMKIRAPKNPVMTAMWESWGVSTYPIAWGETFGAIATGVVDGFDSPTDVILNMGFHEHIKYITEATYLPLAAVVIMNEPFFQSLSEEDQAVILLSAAEVDVSHAEFVASNGERVHKALTEDHGVTFCELQDAEVWAEKAQGAWPQLFELVGGGEDWVNMTVKYRDTGAF